MRNHRSILKARLSQLGITQKQVAEAMGWSSNATVSLVLAGKRDWADGELRKMCQIAGVSIVWLAANSDDLLIAENKSTVTLAGVADLLNEEQRQVLLLLAKQMNPPT